MVKENKAIVYAYVGNKRGVATDYEGNRKRNEWVKLNLELDMDESIEKLSWRSDTWGSNNIVVKAQDLDELVGTILTLCDALQGDKDQREAWKKLLRKTIHEWHDTKFHRFNLKT